MSPLYMPRKRKPVHSLSKSGVQCPGKKKNTSHSSVHPSLWPFTLVKLGNFIFLIVSFLIQFHF